MSASDHSSVKPFIFITPEREELFCQAVNGAIEDYQRFAIQNPLAFKEMDNRQKSEVRRVYLSTRLKNVFKGTEGVKFRHDGNAFLITFDDTHVIHLKKLDCATFLGVIPKTLLAVETQLRLFEDEEEVPLAQLYDLVAGYIIDEAGIISRFMFNDQEHREILDTYELNLSQDSSSDSQVDNEPSPQAPSAPQTKTEIRLKSKKKEGDDKQSREA